MSFVIKNGVLKKYVYDCCWVEDVVIPEGVTEIGRGAFWTRDQSIDFDVPESM